MPFFLINPPGSKRTGKRGAKVARRRRARLSARSPKRRKRRLSVRRSRTFALTLKGAGMAHRRRRRRRSALARSAGGRFLKRNPPARHRRRRHRSAGVGVSRRRRVSHHFRRNPPGGIVGAITEGVKDGAAVVAGQVANRKIVGAVTGMFAPAAGGTASSLSNTLATPMGKVGVNVAAAIGVTILARKFARGSLASSARFVAAGAFSEAINCALAQTPIAAYLGAYRRPVTLGAIGPVSRSGRGMNAYPGAVNTVRAGVGGYVMPVVPQARQVG